MPKRKESDLGNKIVSLEETLKQGVFDGSIKLDVGGHFGCDAGVVPTDVIEKNLRWSISHWLRDFTLFAVLADTSDINLDSLGNLLADHDVTTECGECGAKVKFRYEPGRFYASSECKYPGGQPDYSVLLNVPSGRIVFANDLRDLVVLRSDDPSHYVNHVIEQIRCTKDYADAGMVHAFVGNTCPGVYQQQDGTIRVVSPCYRWDEDEDEVFDDIDEDEDEVIERRLGKRVAGICTDLWWFSAMDEGLFRKSCEEIGTDEEDYSIEVVDVVPGLYEFTIHTSADRDDCSKDTIFSTCKRVGDCREVIVPLNTTARHFLEEDLLRQWSRDIRKYSFYPTFSYWLEHCFCTLGNGRDWSRGVLTSQTGAMTDKPYFADVNDSKIRSLSNNSVLQAIPVIPTEHFVGVNGIYPMSGNYITLAEIPENVNVTWLTMGLIFAKTMVNNPQCYNKDRNSNGEQSVIGEKVLNLLATYIDDHQLWEDVLRISGNIVRYVFPECSVGRKALHGLPLGTKVVMNETTDPSIPVAGTPGIISGRSDNGVVYVTFLDPVVTLNNGSVLENTNMDNPITVDVQHTMVRVV